MANATTDGRLVYVDDYGSKLRELLLQMPYARVRGNHFTFQFTPVACWDLMRSIAEPINADVGVRAAAESVSSLKERGDGGTYPMLKTKPWKHQARGIDFVNKASGAYLAMGMGCIDGEAIVSISRNKNTRKMKLSEAFRLYNGRRVNRSNWNCRCLVDGRFTNMPIETIVQSGVKETVTVALENGYSLKCTPDHLVMTSCGWRRADSLTSLESVACNGSSGFVDKDGYVRVRCRGHHRAWKRGQVYQHILVAEQKYGRKITADEHIHHINGNRSDNRPENLEVMSQAEHNRAHMCRDRMHGGSTINGGRVVVVPEFSSVVSVTPSGVSMTYDIAMKSDPHNFVADGVVVHNCGKSLTTIGAIADHKKTLILTPKSVVRVWPREFARHANFDCNVVPIVTGNTAKKVQQARQALSTGRPTTLVINYEAARCKEFADWATSQSWDCVVCDEAHRTKAPSGVTAKLTHKLGRMAEQRISLSGTPLPHDILDAWSQFMFIDPGVFGTNYMRFKRRYSEIGFFNEVKSFKNIDEFTERFRLLSYEVSSDVLDLPPLTHQSRVFELSAATMRSYTQLQDELAAYIESGVVTAANSLVTTIRLQQITSGFYKDDNTDQIVDLNDSAKADALVDIIDDLPRGEPIVVFAKFTRDLERIKAIAESFGLRYGELSGRCNDLTSEATMRDDIDIMGVNIQSGGVGIDLTRAAYAVYYSLSWSSGEFEQSIRRLYRPGQNRHVTCMHLIAANTIDERIYAAIEERRAIEEAIVYGITERKSIIKRVR